MELICITALREEAVRIVAIGQGDNSNRNVCTSELRGQTPGSLATAAVAVSIEGQPHSPMVAAQLLILWCIQMRAQRAGDVVKTCLPQCGIVEETFDQNDLRSGSDVVPSVKAALAAWQEPVRVC